MDEAREKSTLHADNIRNMENRVNELLETETGRQDRFNALMQQAALQQLEHDRSWKDWQEKLEQFNQQAGDVRARWPPLRIQFVPQSRHRIRMTVLNQRLERRVAEIGEIQRLADERLRQEWIAFKADEQKRWTGHTLAQEESIRDLRKDFEKIEKHPCPPSTRPPDPADQDCSRPRTRPKSSCRINEHLPRLADCL